MSWVGYLFLPLITDVVVFHKWSIFAKLSLPAKLYGYTYAECKK